MADTQQVQEASTPQAPARRVEITWQSVLGAFLISSVVAGSYPYIVLKLGLGPNVSVVSAFLGAIFLSVTARRTRGRNRLLNNVIQTAGTSAASTAFMCVVAAAFGFLDQNETVNVHVRITPWEMFTWLSCSGMIGVVFTVLFRKHFLDDKKMIFADGVAAAETVIVLDSAAREAGDKMWALGLAGVAAAGLNWLRDGWKLAPTWWWAKPYNVGMEWGFLTIGSGILVGLNMGLSMLLGTLVIWFWLGPWIVNSGIGLEIVRSQIAPQYWAACQQAVAATAPTPEQTALLTGHCGPLQAFEAHNYFRTVMLWAMWPATALMVCSAITAIALRWRSIVDTFRTLRANRGGSGEDMSLRAILAWAGVLTVILAVVQQAHFGMSPLQTVVAVLASLPLMLVGIRVLGETNQGPVSAMANALQAVFAVFWPSHIPLNLIAAGMAGNTSSQSEGTMQDYKTGQIVGSTPRILTYVQLAAVPIGAAAVAIMYPLLIHRYGLGTAGGLAAPTGLKIANMAVLLSKGTSALPRHALEASIIAAVAGIVIAVVKERWHTPWIPSVAGFGFSLILGGVLNIPMAVGAVAGSIWQKASRRTYDRYAVTVASGFIAGEALLAGLVLPILYWYGILQ